MAVHLELAELDEMREERSADGGQRFTATRVLGGLGKRSLPAKVTLRLVLHFRTEPGEDVSIATDVLSHTGEAIFSREDSTKVPGNGQAVLAIDLSVTLAKPGSFEPR